jgi:hypothetical protein
MNSGNPSSAFESLFGTIALLGFKNISINKIALPILGTGFQGNSIEFVLPKLLELSLDCLNRVAEIHSLFFIENDLNKAMEIDASINKYLHRSNELLESVFEDAYLIDLFNTVSNSLLRIRGSSNKFKNNHTINTLIDKIENRKLRFFELAILSRKLLELLLSDLVPLDKSSHPKIIDYINELRSKNVADWMITYLHTLRIFGNFVAHENGKLDIPNHMEKTEMVVYVNALNRVLEFYLEFQGKL